MGLFKSRAEKELDAAMLRIDMNVSNNYKDAAQMDLVEFEELLISFEQGGKIKGKSLLYYEKRLGFYKEKLKGYTHKDQKPYWT